MCVEGRVSGEVVSGEFREVHVACLSASVCRTELVGPIAEMVGGFSFGLSVILPAKPSAKPRDAPTRTHHLTTHHLTNTSSPTGRAGEGATGTRAPTPQPMEGSSPSAKRAAFRRPRRRRFLSRSALRLPAGVEALPSPKPFDAVP